jgi:hypothetical protein
MGVGEVMVSKIPNQGETGDSCADKALHDLRLIPISRVDAKTLIVRNHYSHTLPGGTKMSFGVILNGRLLGVMTFGVGPFYGYKLVDGATPDDVVTLTRLWLSDELPRNSESKEIPVSNLSWHIVTRRLDIWELFIKPQTGFTQGYQRPHRYTILEMEYCTIRGVWRISWAVIQYVT